MADFPTIHPLGDLTAIKGNSAEGATVTLTIRTGVACAQLFARKGKEKSLATRMKIESLPGAASETADYSALPIAPNQWMLASKKNSKSFCDLVAETLAIFL